MKPLTREWVKKAEGDFAVMQREARARGKPVYDVICFHAQQCAEKYLKARLQEAVQPFSKTHDLPGLLQVLLPLEPGVHVSKCTRQSVPRASRPPLPSDSASLPRAGGTPAVHL
ncbi:MAG: HEPN domain-containing protein, partial [Planctomycetota bacterium]